MDCDDIRAAGQTCTPVSARRARGQGAARTASADHGSIWSTGYQRRDQTGQEGAGGDRTACSSHFTFRDPSRPIRSKEDAILSRWCCVPAGNGGEHKGSATDRQTRTHTLIQLHLILPKCTDIFEKYINMFYFSITCRDTSCQWLCWNCWNNVFFLSFQSSIQRKNVTHHTPVVMCCLF